MLLCEKQLYFSDLARCILCISMILRHDFQEKVRVDVCKVRKAKIFALMCELSGTTMVQHLTSGKV